MYNIYETVDDKGRRNVFNAPNNWEIDGNLYWPPKSKKINIFRKSRKTPETDWECFQSFKILATNLPTFKDALAKEKLLELHSDSESVEEAKKRETLKRRHPVNSEFSNLFELNSAFDAITTSILNSAEIIDPGPNPNSNRANQFNEGNIDMQSGINNLDYNVDFGGMDIEGMEFLLDENTGNLEFISNELNELSNVSNEIISSNQNYQAQSSSEITDTSTLLRITSLENKLDSIEKKLDLKLKISVEKQDAILMLLAGNQVKLDLLVNNMTSAKKNNQIPKNVVEIPITLPIETEDDKMKLEMIIKNDADVVDTLENKLVLIGGADSRKCLYEIMKTLFADDLLMNYTWHGTADKSPFKKLKINDLMKKCVRVNYDEYTDDEFKNDVQEHLKHASTRVERRYL